jgi:hypothetical protein
MLLIAACSNERPNSQSTAKIDQTKLDKLLKFNDLNERAFAYHQHCIDKSKQMNPIFSNNFEQVANLLLHKSIETMGWDSEYATDQILDRREKAQKFLNIHYRENGCYSPEAFKAKEHYYFISQPMTIK